MTTQPNSILIHTKEWFDKTYGNSYFATRIYIDGELFLTLPFQYGYYSMGFHTAMEALLANGKVPNDSMPYYLKRDFGIIVYDVKESNQKKADVKLWGKP